MSKEQKPLEYYHISALHDQRTNAKSTATVFPKTAPGTYYSPVEFEPNTSGLYEAQPVVGAMAQLDDANQKGNWPPHDSLAHHLATHTPIQVPRQPDGASGAFHTMQHQGPWRLPFGGFAPTQPQSLFRPTWQQPTADWQANNNKVNEWEKWNPTLAGELARPRPQLLSSQFGSQMLMGHAALSAVSPDQVVVDNCEESKNDETPMDQDDLHSPKEDERKSLEHHSASYDASATPSLSGDDDERRLDVETADNNSEGHIDVEETTTLKAESEDQKTQNPTAILNVLHYASEDMKEDRNDEIKTTEKEEDASHLLLNFTQQSLTSSSDQTHISCATPSTDEKSSDNTIAFGQSGTSAFSNPESAQTSVISNTPVSSSSGFCRPPGLGPTTFMPPTSGQGTPLVCPICGFSCNSKFHYNSHMNTHGDHQCTMCDYTSRTEGRLKKHMRESHTVEEQLAAGLDIKAPTPPPSSSATATIVTTRSLTTGDTSSLSTTMASLVNVANLAAAAVAAKQEPSNNLATALSIENVSSNGFLNTIAPTGLPSALDQIRAFAENSALLPESGVNLANALSVMSQEITEGIERTPEKSANSEPRRNSNGKMKQYKCKQCPHISFSKDDQWAHSRTHIPVDKQMNCPTCNFVTEYKHHLEYHIRNHIGSKPFQCKKCSYTCVNKSMLNSHMKSHTNIYQFRCLNCTYATKYCHSLKLHLKKYGHHRVPDGVDMGDTSPTQVQSESVTPYHNFALNLETSTPATSLAQTLGLGSIITSQSLNYASQMLLRQHQMKEMNSLMGLNGLPSIPQPTLKCAVCEYQTSSQDELIRHNMNHFLNQQTQGPIVNLYQALPQMSSLIKPVESLTRSDQQGTVDSHEEHDSGHAGDDEMEGSSGSTGSPHCSFKGSGDETEQPGRKSKAFKLEQISQRLQGKSPSCSEDGSGMEDKDTDEVIEHHEDSSLSSSDPLSQSSMVSSVAQPVVTTTSQSQAFTSVTSESNLNIFQQAYLAQLNALQAKREDSSYPFQCQHCRVGFQDQALYHIHMGYHGYEHVFKCNRCGHIASDYLNFNLHLLQASHE